MLKRKKRFKDLEQENNILGLKVSKLEKKVKIFGEKIKVLSQEIDRLREVYNAVNIAFTDQRRSQYTRKLKSLLHSYPDQAKGTVEVSNE